MTFTHDDYTVGWICTLAVEALAATAMLDQRHPSLPLPKSDKNSYTFGIISGHNVVITCLPAGVYRTNLATTVVNHMRKTFSSLRLVLTVGIGGGVPSKNRDIRLGDIVISTPSTTSSDRVYYDHSKEVSYNGRVDHTIPLYTPLSQFLLTGESTVQAYSMIAETSITEIMQTGLKSTGIVDLFSRPDQDWLFTSSYDHLQGHHDCSSCDKNQTVHRVPRAINRPLVHYGLIASGDEILEDARTRDAIAQDLDILCFDTGSARLMNGYPCLVIRGISYYCDSHNNKQWQDYAALSAAAYAKLLLSYVPPTKHDQRGHWMVPLARNPLFSGHEDEIRRLEQSVMLQTEPIRIAITGSGWDSPSHTQVALELAYRIRDLVEGCSVFWLSCTSPDAIKQAYLDIAERLQLRPVNIEEQFETYLHSERAGKWLLIFDGADDVDMFKNIHHGLPQSSTGCILFTTRSRSIAMELAPLNVVSIPNLDKKVYQVPLKNPGYDSSHVQKKFHGQGMTQKQSLDTVDILSPEDEIYLSTGPSATEDSDDEAQSNYTEGPFSPISKEENYIRLMVEGLFHKIKAGEYDPQISEQINNVLPRLLRIFAYKLGRSETQMYRDIVVFISKHSSEIAKSLQVRYESGQYEADPQNPDHNQDDMDMSELMELWKQHTRDKDISHSDDDLGSLSTEDDDPAESDTTLPGVKTYRAMLREIPAYEWLLESVSRGLTLLPGKPDARKLIRTEILNSLPQPSKISRLFHPPTYTSRFILKWDPVAFINEQDFDSRPDNLFERIITITGTNEDAQAMTCLDYLNQTWYSCGAEILKLIESTVRNGSSPKDNTIVIDNTRLRSWLNGTDFVMEVTGTSDSMAEVGEQLAWLGAALRSSPYESEIYYCTPYIDSIRAESPLPKAKRPPHPQLSFVIDFMCDWQQQTDSSAKAPGQCWHHLFQNPTVVTGYPIARRHNQGRGLEITLSILGGVLGAPYVDTFDNKIIIKGFSAMLIPTEYSDAPKMVLWHLVYNPDGDRLSFSESNKIQRADIAMDVLEESRHVVGWCSAAKSLAGTNDAACSIGRSRLYKHSPRMLANKSILARKLIPHDSAVYGKKDRHDILMRDIDADKVKWLAEQYVLLWDVGDKRGWLVNGASALLHLLCAAIKFDEKEKVRFPSNLDAAQISRPGTSHDSASATKTLLSLFQMESQTCDSEESSIRLRNRVEQLYNTLEKIIEHQRDIMGAPETLHSRDKDKLEALEDMPRKILEGWDFQELALYKHPLNARAYKLGTRGKGWVDFTRAIYAATLFATGFGEIIQPVLDHGSSCSHWKELPKGKSYLAVSGPDLSTICDELGNPNATPIRLAKRLIWYSVDEISQVCQCTTDQRETESCELAQVILPEQFLRQLPKKQYVKSNQWQKGAVVFGYNNDFKWFWTDTGYPKKGEAPASSGDSESESEHDEEFHDTGLGTSAEESVVDDEIQQLPELTLPRGGLTYSDFTVGIICALGLELRAVRTLFDREMTDLRRIEGDPNAYCLGGIGSFSVVAVGLPAKGYGTNNAVLVTSHLMRTFSNIKFCLLVGIGGGVPSPSHDIRLGDVVVGTSIIQYDMGKHIQNAKFRMTGQERQLPADLSSFVTKLESERPELVTNQLLEELKTVSSKHPTYKFPGAKQDTLFEPHVIHKKDETTCGRCTSPMKREKRATTAPQIFYGSIASGNKLMRDARLRDRLGRENNVICFEMEAAGVVISANCLTIRGISDYADSHKNKQWQEYAAATAASFAKFFLLYMAEDQASPQPSSRSLSKRTRRPTFSPEPRRSGSKRTRRN